MLTRMPILFQIIKGIWWEKYRQLKFMIWGQTQALEVLLCKFKEEIILTEQYLSRYLLIFTIW